MFLNWLFANRISRRPVATWEDCVDPASLRTTGLHSRGTSARGISTSLPDVETAVAASVPVIVSPLSHCYLDVPYAEPSADPRQAERQGRVGQRVYTPKTIAEFVRLGTGRSAARSSSARRSRSLARQATSTRSPGRKRSWPAKLAADHAADRLIALSLPPRRPIAHHSSRTLRLGGSRSATSRKKASSCGVIRSAKPNAPFQYRPPAVPALTIESAAEQFGIIHGRGNVDRDASSGRFRLLASAGAGPIFRMGQHAPRRDGPTCSHRGATAKVSRAQLCWECPRDPLCQPDRDSCVKPGHSAGCGGATSCAGIAAEAQQQCRQ